MKERARASSVRIGMTPPLPPSPHASANATGRVPMVCQMEVAFSPRYVANPILAGHDAVDCFSLGWSPGGDAITCVFPSDRWPVVLSPHGEVPWTLEEYSSNFMIIGLHSCLDDGSEIYSYAIDTGERR